MITPPPHRLPVVLVTGASRGLGRGVALELARAGYSVGINYATNRGAADETVLLCQAVARSPEQRFLPFAADIGDPVQRDGLIPAVVTAFGALDGLVNNAGIAPRQRKDITEATEESFTELIRVNLAGPHFLTQAAARYWLSTSSAAALPGGFKVIFITSISADTASLARSDYCISKAGLAMAAQVWAVRLAEDGIQVVELRPGIMATDMTAGVKEKYDQLIAGGGVPQRRWGTAEDVGRAAASVLAGHFAFSTGAVIPVDGGFHLRRL